MSKTFRIFVDSSEVYTGSFSEVPNEYRDKVIEALSDWGEVLGKSGLNEMIYSLFTWYHEKEYNCKNCQNVFEEETECKFCGEVLTVKDKFQKNQKINHLLTCIGMITHVEIN